MTPFDPGVRPGQRFLIIMRHMLIERLVFVVGDLVFRARPKCVGLIHGLFFTGGLHGLGLFVPGFLDHANRQRDVVGVLAQDFADLPAVEQVGLLLAQVQNHFRTAPRMVDLGHGVITFTA